MFREGTARDRRPGSLAVTKGPAAGVQAVKQALQAVLEDRVEVEVERFPDSAAEPWIIRGVRPPSQVAVVMAHPVVRRHSAVLLRLGFRQPGERHAAHM